MVSSRHWKRSTAAQSSTSAPSASAANRLPNSSAKPISRRLRIQTRRVAWLESARAVFGAAGRSGAIRPGASTRVPASDASASRASRTTPTKGHACPQGRSRSARDFCESCSVTDRARSRKSRASSRRPIRVAVRPRITSEQANSATSPRCSCSRAIWSKVSKARSYSRTASQKRPISSSTLRKLSDSAKSGDSTANSFTLASISSRLSTPPTDRSASRRKTSTSCRSSGLRLPIDR